MRRLIVATVLVLGLGACGFGPGPKGRDCGWVTCEGPPTECDGNCSQGW